MRSTKKNNLIGSKALNEGLGTNCDEHRSLQMVNKVASKACNNGQHPGAKSRKVQRLGLGLILALFSGLSFAQGNSASSAGVDAAQMLINLNQSIPYLHQLVTAFSYVLGFLLAIRGIYYLKLYGELRTMTASQTTLRTPVTYLLAAAAMLYAPTIISTLLSTSFGYDSPLKYDQINVAMNPLLLEALVKIVQLVGIISFIRGWMILVANAQNSGGGQHTMGRALTHIIGGILAINIVGLADILWNTFGFKFYL